MATMPPAAVIEFVERDVDAKGLDSGPVQEKKAEAEYAAGVNFSPVIIAIQSGALRRFFYRCGLGVCGGDIANVPSCFHRELLRARLNSKT